MPQFPTCGALPLKSKRTIHVPSTSEIERLIPENRYSKLYLEGRVLEDVSKSYGYRPKGSYHRK